MVFHESTICKTSNSLGAEGRGARGRCVCVWGGGGGEMRYAGGKEGKRDTSYTEWRGGGGEERQKGHFLHRVEGGWGVGGGETKGALPTQGGGGSLGGRRAKGTLPTQREGGEGVTGGKEGKRDTSYTEGACGGGEGHWGGGGGRRAKGALPTQRERVEGARVTGGGGRRVKGTLPTQRERVEGARVTGGGGGGKEGERDTSYTEMGGRREKGTLSTQRWGEGGRKGHFLGGGGGVTAGKERERDTSYTEAGGGGGGGQGEEGRKKEHFLQRGRGGSMKDEHFTHHAASPLPCRPHHAKVACTAHPCRCWVSLWGSSLAPSPANNNITMSGHTSENNTKLGHK